MGKAAVSQEGTVPAATFPHHSNSTQVTETPLVLNLHKIQQEVSSHSSLPYAFALFPPKACPSSFAPAHWV